MKLILFEELQGSIGEGLKQINIPWKSKKA